MPQSTVAIIGRPNVGKSTLFNRLVGKRLALVDDQPGVTRDRREGEATLIGLEFTVVDTAGFEDEDPASLPGRMRQQTEAAVAGADVALFMIDARAGWCRSTRRSRAGCAGPHAGGGRRQQGRGPRWRERCDRGDELGLGDPIPLSAEHGEGMADLFDALRPHVDRTRKSWRRTRSTRPMRR
jgi:GTP-binding protein